ncbi:MAG: multiheme c-type cytochrome [Roseibacillus sp.]
MKPTEDFSKENFGEEHFGEENFGGEPFGGENFGEKPGAAAAFGEVEEEEEKEPKVVFANAAEAHVRFLDLLESEKRFPSASACAACHPDHFREWSVSAHSYAQLSPVFNAMHATIFKATSGTNGDFCIRCHTQVGMQRDEPLFTSNFKRHPASLEGITCVVCHRVDRNYGKVSGRTAVVSGDVYQPVYGPRGNSILRELLRTNPTLKPKEDAEGQRKIHRDVIKFDPISTSGFCGSCHDVNLLNGFRLEEAFTQFKNSPASKAGKTCQDCHMGKVPGAKIALGEANYHRGPAARIGGDLWATNPADEGYGAASPPRKRTNHMFAGPDYSIIHPGLFPHSKEIRDLLWDMQNQRIKPNGDIEVKERANLRHIIKFKWEDGWGNVNSSFEKRAEANPSIGKGLPWPWNDRQYRIDFRTALNGQFKLLNVINTERFQVLRRGFQLGTVKLTRNDAKGLAFEVEVLNGTDGHGVPTGFDAERLVFLQVTVRDANGRIVMESGDRDPNGDVRDLHSLFVHHNAKKTDHWLETASWKARRGMSILPEDTRWRQDYQLFSLQSKFLVRNQHGGEREQVLAVNYSVNPLPYIRPDTFPGILRARPAGIRKQAVLIPPNGKRIAKYKVSGKALTGAVPYTANLRFITQMVPVNLISEISGVGFDYNLAPREVGKRVVYGHRVSSSRRDSARRGGAQVLWDRTLVFDGKQLAWNLRPTERQIMAIPPGPFPYDRKYVEKQAQGGGIIELPPLPEVPLPTAEPIDPDFTGEDFGGAGKPKGEGENKEEDFSNENFGNEE